MKERARPLGGGALFVWERVMAGRRGGPERRVDRQAMGCFLAGLKAGENVEAAARAAGFHWRTFYRRRDSDRDFAAAWDEAVELSNRPVLLAPGNGRRLQLRKTRKVRFTEARKETFLAHFAGTCDLTTSAEAAGVCADTVNNHRRRDADFAEACQAALEQGYARLVKLYGATITAPGRYGGGDHGSPVVAR